MVAWVCAVKYISLQLVAVTIPLPEGQWTRTNQHVQTLKLGVRVLAYNYASGSLSWVSCTDYIHKDFNSLHMGISLTFGRIGFE